MGARPTARESLFYLCDKYIRIASAIRILEHTIRCRKIPGSSGPLDVNVSVGIDRHTGAYIPELAEQWTMAPDGKSWTLSRRQGIPFHEQWGLFTAQDVGSR